MTNLITQDGVVTPLFIEPVKLDAAARERICKKIQMAAKAAEKEFTDKTPEYWEAKVGDTRVLSFIGFKPIKKKDEAGNVIGDDFAVVFFDGNKEVVCNQVALKDAMRYAEFEQVYKITCTEAVKKQAKKFKVLAFANA